MKKLLAVILSAVMVLGLCTFASYAEVADISIGTYDQLVSWASSSSDNEGQTVVLTADITAPASTTFTPKATFRGTFDGQGHSITGTTSSGSGLINALYGTVRNLYQIDAVVTGDSGVGGIAGTVYGGALVENVYSNATVTATASNVGGIAGKQDGSTVTFNSCWFDGAATSGGIYVAGILGNQNHNSAVFTDCLNTGAITSSGGDNASGISSAVYNGYITATRCVNAGAITGTPRWCGSLVTTIGNTSWDHDTSMSHCSFTDCYGVAGTCQNILPPDFRYNNGSAQYATYDGTGIGTVDALDDLRALVSFGYNWGLKTVGDSTLVVPMYFADDEIALTDYAVFIGTYAELVSWASDSSDDEGRLVVLTADVTAPASTTFTPKATFRGTFDGQGHSITGTTSSGSGLINSLYGTVRNLYQIGVTVTGDSGVGGIAGTVYGGALVENVYSSATVTATGNHVGGIAGIQSGSTVTFNSCWFDGTVTSSGGIHIAGILGNQNSNSAVFTDCLNTGAITSSGDNASGISASVYNGYITATRCVNAGTITGKPRWCGSLVTTIGNTSWDHDTTMSHCSFTDCYGVAGTCQNILPPDFRYSGNYATYDGTGIGTIGALSELDTVSSYGDTWGLKTVGASSLIVPMYFSDEVVVPVDPTISISTYAQFVFWASSASDDTGMTVLLTADIKAPANSTFTPKASFRGTFDGQGHSITGTTSSDSGLIKALYGTVRNLYQIDASVTGTENVGGIAGSVYGGARIENVYSSANVTATLAHVGGIAGDQQDGSGSAVTFVSCWFDGTVTADGSSGSAHAAGILGDQKSRSAIFIDCLNTGTISASGSNDDNISGISASVYNGYITATRCVNAGTIVGDSRWTGALVTTIGNTSWDHETSMSHCAFTDCYGVFGTCAHILPNDFRYNDGSSHYAAYDGTGIGTIGDLSELESVASYGDTWGLKNVGASSIIVPLYFADAPIVPADPTLYISNYAELAAWASSASDDMGKTVVLTADVTAPASTTFTPKATFKGTFDGQGHSIIGTTSSGSGLITDLYGTVKNLYQVDATVTGDSYVGGIASKIYGGALVENVYSSAMVTTTGNHVGGFVGIQADSTVTFNSCWFDGTVTAGGIHVAGILGNQNSNSAVFTDCLNTGTITSSGDNASGISASVYSGYITAVRCVNAGTIVGTPRWCGSLVTTIGNTAWDHDTSMSHCSFTDCYGVAGTCENILPPDFRYSGNYVTYDGEGIGTIGDLYELDVAASYINAWGRKTAGDFELVVPLYFADEAIVPFDPSDALDVGDFKNGSNDPDDWDAPAFFGKRFAGWYTDSSYSVIFKGTEGTAAPKFVDKKVMSVKAQASNSDNSVRFLSTIDASLYYQKVGFTVEVDDQGYKWSGKKELNSVYSTVMSAGETKLPSQISGSDESAYITFCKLTGIPEMNNVKITVTAFWITPDGTTVWGEARDLYITCASGVVSISD